MLAVKLEVRTIYNIFSSNSNRAQKRIIISRLVLTKSRRRSYDLRNG